MYLGGRDARESGTRGRRAEAHERARADSGAAEFRAAGTARRNQQWITKSSSARRADRRTSSGSNAAGRLACARRTAELSISRRRAFYAATAERWKRIKGRAG